MRGISFCALALSVFVSNVALADPQTSPPPKPDAPHPTAPTAKPDAHQATKPPPKPDPHLAQKPAQKPSNKGNAKAPGKNDKKTRGGVDDAARRSIAGGPTTEEATAGVESPELIALRDAEKELFAPAAPKPGNPWPNDAPYPLPIDPDRPVVHASGLPPEVDPRIANDDETRKLGDIGWIQNLKKPDLDARWDSRVIRFLQYFRDDPRGRSLVSYGWKRSGKYREIIKRALRAEHVPDSLLWVSMVESGFEPTAKSHAGAAGLFQFMPDGGRVYGLRVDRWQDDRLDPVMSATAGARYLSDLQRRFGGWELALAAYNMGYGGMLAAVRKYNTNDFYELSRYEAGIPWETTLYVPKIVALAIVAENPRVFGLDTLTQEMPLAFDTTKAPSGTSLDTIARAANAKTEDVAALNPQLRAKRTPPDFDTAQSTETEVRVPSGQGETARARIQSLAQSEPKLGRFTVRFGQTVDLIAQELGVSRHQIYELNGLSPGEILHPGDVLLVPSEAHRSTALAERPVVVAPPSPSSLPDRSRVFYRVIPGDTLRAIADAFQVSTDELRSWNEVDPSVRLQEGMTLQVFVPKDRDLSQVQVLRAEDATVLTSGSEEFFQWFEAKKNRKRVTVTVGPNDTWRSIAGKYACTVGTLERINRRAHTEPLHPGETIVVYTGKSGAESSPEKPEVDPLADVTAPHPEDLPAIP